MARMKINDNFDNDKDFILLIWFGDDDDDEIDA